MGPPVLLGMSKCTRTFPGYAATVRASRIASSRASNACGILSISPVRELVWRYRRSRSEERRVGKECRYRGGGEHEKKKEEREEKDSESLDTTPAVWVSVSLRDTRRAG